MRAAYRLSSSLNEAPARRRLLSLGLALLIELLLILVLLGLGERRAGSPVANQHNQGITFFPDALPAPTPTQAQTAPHESAPPKTPDVSAPIPPPVVKLPTPPDNRALPILEVTRDVYAASDISKLGRRGAPTASGSGEDSKLASDDTEVVGTAPDGTPMYAAEWVRRPTDRELDTYLPPHPPLNGYGLVACKTIARYHVQDCVELENSPPGSHLAGSVRQAAWQFLVRPPRVGGKELTGTWVRIKIDYELAGEKP